MAKLEGKVALITGAAVGLGEGIAEVYAKYGAKMCMVDLSPEVEKTADRLRKEYGADIITYVGNVADKAQMKEAAAKTAEKFGEMLGDLAARTEEAAHPLLQAPNVLATPHVAFASEESMEARAAIVFSNLSDWMDGEQENVIL